jgi:hypothetical protein
MLTFTIYVSNYGFSHLSALGQDGWMDGWMDGWIAVSQRNNNLIFEVI